MKNVLGSICAIAGLLAVLFLGNVAIEKFKDIKKPTLALVGEIAQSNVNAQVWEIKTLDLSCLLVLTIKDNHVSSETKCR